MRTTESLAPPESDYLFSCSSLGLLYGTSALTFSFFEPLNGFKAPKKRLTLPFLRGRSAYYASTFSLDFCSLIDSTMLSSFSSFICAPYTKAILMTSASSWFWGTTNRSDLGVTPSDLKNYTLKVYLYWFVLRSMTTGEFALSVNILIPLSGLVFFGFVAFSFLKKWTIIDSVSKTKYHFSEW